MTKGDNKWIKNWKPKGVKMKPTKKRPAKRKPLHGFKNELIAKLMNLKYRLNDAYNLRDIDTKSDKDFVIGLINNIRKRNENPTKIQLEECNKIWRKYA